MRLIAVAAALTLAAFAGVALAQPPGPGRPAPGAPGVNVEQMLDQLAARIGLSDSEKAAAKQAIQAKLAAVTALRQELQSLAETARKQGVTEQELASALKRYEAALATYRRKLAETDAQLARSLSIKARVALTVLGVLDNGLGPRFAGPMAGRGPWGGRRAAGAGTQSPRRPQ